MQESSELLCYYCQRPLEQDEIKMQCSQCKDFHLCMDCYFSKIEIKMHKASHLMFPGSSYNLVIWPDGFTLQDDLQLLDTIQLLGFGSWHSIKKHMKRPESEPIELLVKHYFTVFGTNGIISQEDSLIQYGQYNNNYNILNQQSIKGYGEKINNQHVEIQTNTNQYKHYQEVNDYITEYTQLNQVQNNEYINKIIQQPLNLLSNAQQHMFNQYTIFNDSLVETGEGNGKVYFQGCWPRRFDTVYEYINKAEYSIMHMHIQQNDPKEQINLKVQVLQSYAFRLVQRQKIKEVVFQNSLHRIDQKIDDITINTDLQMAKICNQNIVFQNINSEDYLPDDNQLDQYEMQHSYLFRGFQTRLEFRRYLKNLLVENQTRQQIFRYQIARLLNKKQIIQLAQGQDVQFLMQTDPPPYDISHVPPGILNFEKLQNDKCYTVNNNEFYSEFQNNSIKNLQNKIDALLIQLIEQSKASENIMNKDVNYKLQFLLKQNFKNAGDVTNTLLQIGVTLPAQKFYVCDLERIQIYLNYALNQCSKCRAMRKYHCKFCCSKVCFNNYVYELKKYIDNINQVQNTCTCLDNKNHNYKCLQNILNVNAMKCDLKSFFNKTYVGMSQQQMACIFNEKNIQQQIFNRKISLYECEQSKYYLHNRIMNQLIFLSTYIDFSNENHTFFNKTATSIGNLVLIFTFLFNLIFTAHHTLFQMIFQFMRQCQNQQLNKLDNKLYYNQLVYTIIFTTVYQGADGIQNIENTWSFILSIIQLSNILYQKQNFQSRNSFSDFVKPGIKITKATHPSDIAKQFSGVDDIQQLQQIIDEMKNENQDYVQLFNKIVKASSHDLYTDSYALNLFNVVLQKNQKLLITNANDLSTDSYMAANKYINIVNNVCEVVSQLKLHNYQQVIKQHIQIINQFFRSPTCKLNNMLNAVLQVNNYTCYCKNTSNSAIFQNKSRITCQGGWRGNQNQLLLGSYQENVNMTYVLPDLIGLLLRHGFSIDDNFNYIFYQKYNDFNKNLQLIQKNKLPKQQENQINESEQSDNSTNNTKQQIKYKLKDTFGSVKFHQVYIPFLQMQFKANCDQIIRQIFSDLVIICNTAKEANLSNGELIQNYTPQQLQMYVNQFQYLIEQRVNVFNLKNNIQSMEKTLQQLDLKQYQCSAYNTRKQQIRGVFNICLIELLFCTIFKIQAQIYQQCKIIYLQNGYSLNNTILHHFNYRPLVCELFRVLLVKLKFCSQKQQPKDLEFFQTTSAQMLGKCAYLQSNQNTVQFQQSYLITFNQKPILYNTHLSLSNHDCLQLSNQQYQCELFKNCEDFCKQSVTLLQTEQMCQIYQQTLQLCAMGRLPQHQTPEFQRLADQVSSQLKLQRPQSIPQKKCAAQQDTSNLICQKIPQQWFKQENMEQSITIKQNFVDIQLPNIEKIVKLKDQYIRQMIQLHSSTTIFQELEELCPELMKQLKLSKPTL